MPAIKILAVDDEEDLCEILKFNLEIEGYEVDTAFSAEEALKLDLTQYNLLLLDVMMGEISGFKMASMLRKNEKTANIPIIFLTAKDTENDMLTGFNLGADDYISKPFSIRQVIARVKAVLRRTAESNERKTTDQGLDRRARDPPDQKGVRDPQAPPGKQGQRLLARGDPLADLERRGLRPRPDDRRQHHPPAEENKPLREEYRHPPGIRLLL